MDDEMKSEIEELQAEIRLKTGRQVTQQEVLSRLVDLAVESRKELIDSFRDRISQLDETDRAAFHEGMFASGRRTTEEDIDEELYG